jgi:hypothetical protein
MLSVLALAASLSTIPQGDFYDEDVFRTIDVVFDDANWHQQLVANFGTGVPVLADLTIDGEVLSDVGVFHKGDASYTGGVTLREPLRIALDEVVDGQSFQGFDRVTLDNGRQSSVFNEVVALWICEGMVIAPRANLIHVRAGVVGDMQDLGVYTNTERVDGEFFSDRFVDADGHRYSRNEDNPLLPLPFMYQGTDAAIYASDYVVQGGDEATNFEDVRDVAVLLESGPAATLPAELPLIADVDAFVRTLALESLMRNADGLWRGNNYYLFEDQFHGGRLVPIPWDLDRALLNESINSPPDMFVGPGDHAECPLSRTLESHVWNRRLEAYERHLLGSTFRWEVIEPRLLALKDRVNDTILSSPHEFIHTQGQLDFTIDRIRQAVTRRHRFLTTFYGTDYDVPTIANVAHAPLQVAPGEAPIVVADVGITGPSANPTLGDVLLWSRARGAFESVAMRDDGQHGDGAAGDGRFGAAIPSSVLDALRFGDDIEYYVEAQSATASVPQGDGVEIWPFAGELGAPRIPVAWENLESPLRVTELCYSAADGEFVELTNVSGLPLDLSGWSFDDDSAKPGTLDLSAAGVLDVGESICITDAPSADFRTAWGMPAGSIVLGDNDVAKLGRNDTAHVFDSRGLLRDVLRYGDQDFPGSPRSQGASLQSCNQAHGQDQVYAWTLSTVSDHFGSVSSAGGDVGTPGRFAGGVCGFAPECRPNVPNSTGAAAEIVALGDRSVAAPMLELRADFLPVGSLALLVVGPDAAHVPGAGGSTGNFCIGGAVGRYVDQIQFAGVDGVVEFQATASALPGPDGPRSASAGETWRFQTWYRDALPDGTSTSNLTDVVAVRFAQ